MMTMHPLQPNSIVTPMSVEKRATIHAKKYRNADCFVSHSSADKTCDEKRYRCRAARCRRCAPQRRRTDPSS